MISSIFRDLHLISHQLNLVSWVLLGLTAVCGNVPLGDVRLRRFIVHGLSESLERRRGIGSITPGLGVKVFAQFLFYRSNLAASSALTIVKTLSSNPTVGARYFFVTGADAVGSAAAGRLARR